MKNYLDRLGLQHIPENRADLDAALDALREDTVNTAVLSDAETILGDEIVCEHYLRLVKQYEAMAIAASLLDNPKACNTHRWMERLVEFDAEDHPA